MYKGILFLDIYIILIISVEYEILCIANHELAISLNFIWHT